jgi:hypothetical protein
LIPLRDGFASTAGVEPKNIPKIFANIEEIHGINTRFLMDLEEKINKWAENQTIGPVFLKMVFEI